MGDEPPIPPNPARSATKAGFVMFLLAGVGGFLGYSEVVMFRAGGIEDVIKLGVPDPWLTVVRAGGRTTVRAEPLRWSVGLGVVAVVAAMALRQQVLAERREARVAAGLCAACGYDLRGSPNRCPECGAVPKKKVA